MKKLKYSEEKICAILEEAGKGINISELCEKYNICNSTYYNWKKDYSGRKMSDDKMIRSLESEFSRLTKKIDRLEEHCQALNALKEELSKQ